MMMKYERDCSEAPSNHQKSGSNASKTEVFVDGAKNCCVTYSRVLLQGFFLFLFIGVTTCIFRSSLLVFRS